MSTSSESIGRLFVELGLADEDFVAGMQAAVSKVKQFSDDVKRNGKAAGDAIKPIANAVAQVTESEKRLVAQTVASAAAEKARAAALGVSVAQLRQVDAAQKNAAASAQALAAATAESARRAALGSSSSSAASGLSASRSQISPSASLSGSGVVAPAGTQADTTAQVAQLAALGVAVGGVTSVIRDAVQASANYSNAFSGLRSVANSFGQDANAAEEAAQDLAADGLVPAGAAAQAFKNALASGYSIEQATTLLKGLKEQAVFNRQAHYDMGGAIIATTEGIKNEQSILADATGTTTNLSQMYKVYAEQLGKSVGTLTQAEKRQAAYNGFLAETGRSVGDLAKAQDTLAGTMAKTDTAVSRAKVSLGDALAPAYRLVLGVVSSLAESVVVLTERFPGLTAGVVAAVTALGTMATAISAVRTAVLLFESSMGPVGIALAAVSVALGVAISAYTAYADATQESADAQKELNDALTDTGVAAALKRQALAMEALTAAEQELNDAQDGFSTASKKEVEALRAKAAARERDLIAANAAVGVEEELADERGRVKAQTTATEQAEKKLAELRTDNLSEPAKLEQEMNAVLNSMAQATPDVLEGIREEYLKKISAAQQKAAKDGESAAAKLQKQIDAARKSVQELQDLADAADVNTAKTRAEDAGQDPAIAALEARLREVNAKTEDALEDARAIQNAGARDAAVAAVEVAGEAAKDAVVREWAAIGEAQANAQARAYEKAAAAKRQRTVDLLNKIDLAAMTEGERLALERDQALADASANTEDAAAERAAIEKYYNDQIAASDKELVEKRKKEQEKLRDTYISQFDSIVSGIESVTSKLGAEFADQIEAIDEKLAVSAEAEALALQVEEEGIDALSESEQAAYEDAIENGELLTSAQKAQFEARRENAREAYLAAFNLNKAAAIASIAISTAQGVMSAIASGIPYPGNLVAAAAVGAIGAVQAGIVLAEEPSFDVGGMITEEHRRASPGRARGRSVAANVHVGEGILTEGRGMKAIGGEFGLRLANMGVPLVPASSALRGGAVARAPEPPPFAPRSGGGARATGQAPVVINSLVDGSVVEKTIVRRWDDGSSDVQRRVYKTSGVRVGHDR